MSTRQNFKFHIPIMVDKKFIANIEIHAIASLYKDGTLRCVDISSAYLDNDKIDGYVMAAQPDVWSEWQDAARAHYQYLKSMPYDSVLPTTGSYFPKPQPVHQLSSVL